MSVAFRAIWQDENPNPVEYSREMFIEWLSSKTHPLATAISPRGETHAGENHISIENDGDHAIVLRHRYDDSETQSRWVTTLRSWRYGDVAHYWVDLENLLSDEFASLLPHPPKLIREMIEAGQNPTVWGGPARSAPWVADLATVELLPEYLAETDRLPVMLVSEPPGAVNNAWLKRSTYAAKKLAGLCEVILLNQPETSELREKLGALAVWNGASRLYYPGVDLEGSDAFRHRYWPCKLFHDSDRRLADFAISRIAHRSGRKSPPEDWLIWKESLEHGILSVDDHASCRTALCQEREELAIAYDKLEMLEAETERLKGELFSLRDAVRVKGVDLWEELAAAEQIVADPPPEITRFEDMVDSARIWFEDELSIPAGVLKDAEVLNRAGGKVWTQETFNGIKALAYYVRDVRRGAFSGGGFFEWCKNSNNPFKLPGSKANVAMKESDTVHNDRSMWRRRKFPVSPDLHESGYRHMEAHLKVVKTGGNNVPRIYFADDVKGPPGEVTGKVHIGFIGPHYLVPNTIEI